MSEALPGGTSHVRGPGARQLRAPVAAVTILACFLGGFAAQAADAHSLTARAAFERAHPVVVSPPQLCELGVEAELDDDAARVVDVEQSPSVIVLSAEVARASDGVAQFGPAPVTAGTGLARGPPA